MSVNFSIKNVPDDLAERLRSRALANHRSLQGELMALLEREFGQPEVESLAAFYAHHRAAGLRTASESLQMIQEDRAGYRQ